MSFTVAEMKSFLVARWSQPLRAACPSLSTQARQYVARPPRARVPAPGWVTAQYFQRWLGQAIEERATWQGQQPGAAHYRFGRRSEPCWSPAVTLPHDGRVLRPLAEEEIRWYMGMEIERAYRISQTPQWEIGEDLWTQTLLAACQYLAQLYEELRRRYKAKRARELARRALRLFVEWGADEASQALLIAPPGASTEAGATPLLLASREADAAPPGPGAQLPVLAGTGLSLTAAPSFKRMLC